MRIVWKHLPLDMHKNAMGAHLDAYKRYARELKLDVARFEKGLADLENKKKIDADKAEATSMGVTGTPGFFVNGRYLSGAKPFEEFAKVINAELGRLNVAVPAG